MPNVYQPLDDFYSQGHQYGAQTMPIGSAMIGTQGGAGGAGGIQAGLPPGMPQPPPAPPIDGTLAPQTPRAAPKPPSWSDPNMTVPGWVTPEWQAAHPLGVAQSKTTDRFSPPQQNAFYSFTDRSPKDFKKLVKWFGGEQGAMDWLTPLYAPGGPTRF